MKNKVFLINIFIIVCWLLLLNSTSAQENDILIGKWKGIYICNQGPTIVEIDVYDNLHANFRFFASDSKYGPFDGIFHGRLQRLESTIIFEPTDNNIAEWFIKPTDSGSWVSVSFTALLSENGLSMEGNVNSSGCTTIQLDKVIGIPSYDSLSNCMATYSLNGRVHIPCISVPDAFGGTTVYNVQMQQQSGAFTFDLDLTSVMPR